MPFREKSCWASLASDADHLRRLFCHPDPPPGREPLAAAAPYLGLLFGCVVCLVVVQVVLQTALAMSTREEARQPKDERERLIGMKSDRVAMVVMAGVIGCLWWVYCRRARLHRQQRDIGERRAVRPGPGRDRQIHQRDRVFP